MVRLKFEGNVPHYMTIKGLVIGLLDLRRPTWSLYGHRNVQFEVVGML